VIKIKDYYTLENFTCLPGVDSHDYTKAVERVSDYDGRRTYRISCSCGSSVRALQYANASHRRARARRARKGK
jgi:hypothetical protein